MDSLIQRESDGSGDNLIINRMIYMSCVKINHGSYLIRTDLIHADLERYVTSSLSNPRSVL